MKRKAPDIIQENAHRRKEARAAYNPLTGEGSTSVPRRRVIIEGCPIPTMFLPEDFAATPFVEELGRAGMDELMRRQLGNPNPSASDRDALWEVFCAERIKYDFEFWAAACITISAKSEGRDIPFILTRPQRFYLKYLEDLRRANKPIDIILLKARQWGGSTLTQLYMLWIQLVHRRNWNSVICGHVESASRIVAGMLHKAVARMPLWAVERQPLRTYPYQGSQKTRVLSLTQSRYSIGSVEKPENLRAEDISMAHLTEVGMWGKHAEDLVQSISGSINSGPYTMKVLESTAKGVGNYFHRTWLDAVDGRNNFTPVFVPWFMIDLYSKKIGRKNYESFIESMTEDEHALFSLGATLEAIAWYRTKSLELHDHWRMCSEYPSTPTEAFQSSGRRIFPMHYVEQARRTALPACMLGEFVADGVKGAAAFSHLRFEPRPDHAGIDDVLQVWALPDDTERWHDRYVVSVDVGGSSQAADWSVIKVADRFPMTEVGGVPEVVAEWHGHTEHDLLIWRAAQIAEAYGHALLVVESNTLETEGTEGDHFDYVLDEIAGHYDNLYSRTSPEQIRQGAPVRYGFHTNPRTKPTIIDNLKSALRDGLYIERSLQTTFEMDTYELKENGREMGAVDGCHDDRVMATAILVYVCYHWPLPRKAREHTGHGNKTKIISEASM